MSYLSFQRDHSKSRSICMGLLWRFDQEVTISQPTKMVITTASAILESSSFDTNLSTTGPETVWDRYSEDELYVVFRPAMLMVNRYVTPLWYIIGFPSNLIAVTIWMRPRMRPSSGCFLAALAMADFIFLILHVIFELHSTWEIPLLKFPVICEIFPVFFLASQYMSPMLVLGFTIERYISICHPFKREQLCSTSRTIRVIVGLVVLALLINIVQAYFWQYRHGDCGVREAVTREGTKSIWSVWSWITELLVFGLVPITILVLNMLVIFEANRLAKSQQTILCLRQTQKSSAATVTLLAVSFYLILTTLPVTLCYAMFFNFPQGSFYLSDEEIRNDPVWQRHFTYYEVKTIIQELGMSHYACNFFIYLTTGKLFRKELKMVFFSLLWKKDNSFSNRGSTIHTFVKSTKRENNGNVAHLWGLSCRLKMFFHLGIYWNIHYHKRKWRGRIEIQIPHICRP